MLQHYRWDVVRPGLRRFDKDAYLKAASEPLPGFGISFSSFQPQPERNPTAFLAFDSGHDTWLWYCLWALRRMTGSWPRPVLDGEELPVLLSACSKSSAGGVTVVHALCHCASCPPRRAWARSKCSLPSESSVHAFLLELFGHCLAPSKRDVHIALVGKILVDGCGATR